MNGKKKDVDISELTFALSKVDLSSMPGMLRCSGFHEDNRQNGYEIHYEMPSASSDQSAASLRSILPATEYAGRTSHPLDQRCRFANNIAEAILSLRCNQNQIVHKDICAEHIIMFYPAAKIKFSDREKDLTDPHLLGFGGARWISDESDLVGSVRVEKNLYRHPKRQGAKYTEKDTILDDIYAVGVILLEIGMWRSLLATKKKDTTFSRDIDSNGVEKVDITLWASVSAVPKGSKTLPSDFDWKETPKTYRRMAKRRVSVVLGARFVRVIETCLSCLEDSDRTEGAEELRQAHEKGAAEVSLVFEERVLFELEQIEQALGFAAVVPT